jgi:hypothetical protein
MAIRHSPEFGSYSSILRSLGTDIKVQQDLLRHSSARLTLDTYTQSVTTAKREAQDAVIRLLVADDQSTLIVILGKVSAKERYPPLLLWRVPVEM